MTTVLILSIRLKSVVTMEIARIIAAFAWITIVVVTVKLNRKTSEFRLLLVSHYTKGQFDAEVGLSCCQ